MAAPIRVSNAEQRTCTRWAAGPAPRPTILGRADPSPRTAEAIAWAASRLRWEQWLAHQRDHPDVAHRRPRCNGAIPQRTTAVDQAPFTKQEPLCVVNLGRR
jgi:hypothetical protein